METTPPNPRLCANSTCRAPIPATRRSNAKYCSAACQSVVSSPNHDARRRGQTERTPPAAPERTCARVGCDGAVPIERARHGGRYCSDQCARVARRERSAAHSKRSRALARQRRAARRDRALASRLEALSADATARIKQLEAGTAAIAREKADLEEIALGHEAAARDLAGWLWQLACAYGDQIVTHERVRVMLTHYLPQLRRHRAWSR